MNNVELEWSLIQFFTPFIKEQYPKNKYRTTEVKGSEGGVRPEASGKTHHGRFQITT